MKKLNIVLSIALFSTLNAAEFKSVDMTNDWQKTFGGTKKDRPYTVTATSDGGAVVAGGCKSFSKGRTDACVLKMDSKGNILWTTSDKDTITNMIAMYTCNSLKNSWWEEVNVVIWGGATKLISEDESVHQLITKMVLAGVTVEACKACSDIYNVSEKLQDLGVDVKYMGTGLTDYIKSDDPLITI